MSFHVLMGLFYIGVIVVAVLIAATVLMMKQQKVIILDKANSNVLGLAVFLLALSIMYFIIDYYSVIINAGSCGIFVRILDIWVSVSLQYFWFRFLRDNCFQGEKVLSPLWKFITGGYIVILIESFINYGFILDEQYYVPAGKVRTMALTLQIGQSVFLSLMNLICVICILRYMKKGDKKIFALIATLLLTAEGVQNTIGGAELITGNYILRDYGPETINLTALFLLCFGIGILWYTVKHCFLAQYQRQFVKEDGESGPMAEEKHLEIIAEQASLTSREKEVMKLIYFGATYQGAAETLFISKNTVKHHITKMYEKIGVSSKMELINLVRNQRG